MSHSSIKFTINIGKRTIKKIGAIGVIGAILYSCASVGRPDGGPYDETPPRFLKSNPVAGALNASRKKLVLEFDEYIKLEKAVEKVVVSPPQVQQPEIKASGKKIEIRLVDSLKPKTTYTVDFSDAIVDNNEGNPLDNFSYTFSTGDCIDTLEVSGVVLEAKNLEPVKGILVGLHSNLADSAFTSMPFCRVARTDSRGAFTIKGIAPGTYKAYALMDVDQNFAFTQKSEMLAFQDSVIVPRCERRMKKDTAWVDSLTIDTIIEREYTHYLPDNIILRSFTEDNSTQYLVKKERLNPEKFTLYFAMKADTLPVLKGINFDEKEAFVIEKTLNNDTIHYWIKDSLLYKQDTLALSLTYLYTDTLGCLVPRTDTLEMVPKIKKTEEKTKQERKRRKKDDEEEKTPTIFAQVSVKAPSSMDIYGSIVLEFTEPMVDYDSTMIHLEQKVDTLWQEFPFVFEQDSLNMRKWNLYADWDFEQEFKFTIDSTAFKNLYGLHTDKIEQSFKVRKQEEYATIYFNIKGAKKPAFVELLNDKDGVVRKVEVQDGRADFYFLNPGKYCARLIEDSNANGVWDTGGYEDNLHPETVYYYPTMLEPKANWEVEQDWDIHALPLDKQKLDVLKKQKPDEKKKNNRNASRRN